MMREIGGALAVFTLASCAWVIDLDERPARPVAGAGSVPDASRAEAAVPCGVFCDDFDLGGLGERWRGMPEVGLPPRLVTGDAGLALLPFERASSAPNVLEARADRARGLTVGYLVEGMDVPAEARGLEASADVKLLAIEDLREPGGPLPDSGPPEIFATPRLNVLGLYAPDGATAASAEVVVSSRYVGLVTGQLLEDRDTYAIASKDRDYVTLTAGLWLRVFLAVGPVDVVRTRATESGRPMPECPAAEAVAVVWPSVPRDAATCLPLPAAFAAPGGKRVAIAAGLGLGDRARARVAIDDVRAVALH